MLGLEHLPDELFTAYIIPHLTYEDCLRLKQVSRRYYKHDGLWEKCWKDVYHEQLQIDSRQLMWYLDHTRPRLTVFQQVFVKAAQMGHLNVLKETWRRWSTHTSPNEFLLMLTIQVATRHACASGRVSTMRWLLDHFREQVDNYGVMDNWDFVCASGNVTALKLWMEYHQLDQDSLALRNWFPLMAAANRNRVAVVKYLLDKFEVEPEVFAFIFQHTLRTLVQRGNTMVLELLLQRAGGVSLDFFGRTTQGVSNILLYCVNHQALDAMRLFHALYRINHDEFLLENCHLLQRCMAKPSLRMIQFFVEDLALPVEVWQRSIVRTASAAHADDGASDSEEETTTLLEMLRQQAHTHAHVYSYVRSFLDSGVRAELQEQQQQALAEGNAALAPPRRPRLPRQVDARGREDEDLEEEHDVPEHEDAEEAEREDDIVDEASSERARRRRHSDAACPSEKRTKHR
ncbi:uncharacterized protein MONBRDRAFT_25558 [Monosiga brevicollis MX1]|uniref:F-box domain-containing protein n=1 Tax=Monosiga brevicollis TaxID=81824 RepID=A9UZS1_MONBE|nr:uncharacterized protein MONBRDRAFT_25558 [Monosiga brevicollis MX1]EDQ89281.1 predicted protein [Monosiga brevicollis MX1]|eukprot:XP_001745857.1 hypothetical protein [Monosiga brevicollis MX1]